MYVSSGLFNKCLYRPFHFSEVDKVICCRVFVQADSRLVKPTSRTNTAVTDTTPFLLDNFTMTTSRAKIRLLVEPRYMPSCILLTRRLFDLLQTTLLNRHVEICRNYRSFLCLTTSTYAPFLSAEMLLFFVFFLMSPPQSFSSSHLRVDLAKEIEKP